MSEKIARCEREKIGKQGKCSYGGFCYFEYNGFCYRGIDCVDREALEENGRKHKKDNAETCGSSVKSEDAGAEKPIAKENL